MAELLQTRTAVGNAGPKPPAHILFFRRLLWRMKRRKIRYQRIKKYKRTEEYRRIRGRRRTEEKEDPGTGENQDPKENYSTKKDQKVKEDQKTKEYQKTEEKQRTRKRGGRKHGLSVPLRQESLRWYSGTGKSCCSCTMR